MSTPVVVFDILGTLFPMTPVGEFVRDLLSRELTRLAAAPALLSSLPSAAVLSELVYAELLKEAVCLSYSQYFTPLSSLLPAIVTRVVSKYMVKHTANHHQLSLSAADREQLKSTASSLPPRAGAKDCLSTLAQYAAIIALSNGSAASTQSLLSSASFTSLFQSVHSAETAAAFKPDSNVYTLVLPEAGNALLFFVSVHGWDIRGAMRFNELLQGQQRGGRCRGFITVWVSEEEREWMDEVGEGKGGASSRPDIVAASLTDAAQLIGQYVAREEAKTEKDSQESSSDK
jgi:HAD superfamily hydrolase (TIGR01493 family)